MMYRTFVPAFILSSLLCSCDNHTIHEKSDLTEHLVIKRTMNITVFNEKEKRKPFLLMQQKSQAIDQNFSLNLDSILQLSYWQKENNRQTIETAQRLNKKKYTIQKGRLKSSTTYQLDGDLFLRDRNFFDDQGLLLAKQETNRSLNLIEQSFIYSRDGLIIKKEHFNGDRIIKANSTLQYDTTDYTVTEITKWIDSETTHKTVLTVDENGNILKREEFEVPMNTSLNDTTEYVYEYSYDKKNVLVEMKEYNTWGLTIDYTTRHYLTSRYKYDQHGNVSELEEINPNGTLRALYKNNYTYDNQQNWISKTTVKNDEPYSKLTRTNYYQVKK